MENPIQKIIAVEVLLTRILEKNYFLCLKTLFYTHHFWEGKKIKIFAFFFPLLFHSTEIILSSIK